MRELPSAEELGRWFKIMRANLAKWEADDLETIDRFLLEAKRSGLVWEVLYTARNFVEHDEMQLSEAMRCACMEWDI